MHLAFVARNMTGTVVVELDNDRDPHKPGFPVCTATVSYSGDGYDAFFGWVQLVGEGTPPIFAIDPLRIYERLDTPYAFFGFKPTLFDAPTRTNRVQHVEWLAHSFLCASPSDPMSSDVQAVVGFSWGFVLDRGDVTLTEPRRLDATTWNEHTVYLASKFPAWNFLPTICAEP